MSADESMGVYVDIQGNADSLVHAADQGESSIKGLEGVSKEALASLSAAITKLDLDFTRWTETSRATESQVKKTAETAKSEGTQIEGFADRVLQHNYAVARGLEAVGLSSEASAARVGGAIEAVKTAMSGLNPVLLALTAGAGGMFAFVETLKSSAEAASKWQQNMDVLGQTVRNQGGDWARLRDTVKEWADLQEQTTAFSRDEAVGALRELTAAGTGVADAMKIVRVAEDAAAATGHSLTDVVHGLMEAEHGRTQVLAELGIGTSAMIKKGTDLKTILDLIEKSMGGAASTAADTYAGKVQQLGNALEALKEDIGEKLLPYMTRFVGAVKDWVDAADQNLPRIEEQFGRVYNAAKGVYDFLEKAKPEVEFFFGTVLGVTAIKALVGVRQAFIDLRAQIITSEAWAAMRGSVQAAALVFGLEGGGLVGGVRAASVAFQGLRIAEAGATLGLSLFIGYIASHWDQSVGFATAGIEKLTKAYGALALAMGAVTHNQKLIDIGTNAMAYAQQAEEGGAYAGSGVPTDAERGLPTLLDYQPGGKYYDANPADTGLGSNPQVGGRGTGGSGHASHAHKKSGGSVSGLHDLADSFKVVKPVFDATDEAVKKLTHDLAGLKAAQNDLAYAVAHETTEHHNLNNALYDAEVKLHSAIQAYNEYVDRVKASGVETAADKKKIDSLKLAVDAAQHSYNGLKTKLDAVNASLKHHQSELDSTTAKIKAAQDAQEKAVEASLKKQQEAWQKEHDKEIALTQQWADKASTLIDAFFQHGKGGMKGFADAFKQMLDQMLQSLERSALAGFFQRILGISATSNSSALALPGGGSVPGASVGGGSSLLSLLGLGVTAAPAATAIADPSLVSAYMAAGMSQSDAISMASTVSPSSGGSHGLLGGLGGGIPWGKNIGGASVGSYLAAAAGGALVGQTVFGGKGYADVGGALGATAALALAGPAGWAAVAAMTLGGALLGGGAGSLFGNHFDPKNEPDIYQQDAWGQSNADMNGNTSASPMMANGKAYTMDSWTQQATGGKGWNLTMEKFVQLFRGKESSLPQGLRSSFARIEQLWGGATNQPNFNHDGKDGWLDIGSGARAQWTEFWQYVQQYGPQISQLVDQYQTSDVYTSSNGVATQAGPYTPSGSPNILHDFPDYGVPYTAPSNPGGGSPSPSPSPGPITNPNPQPITGPPHHPMPLVVINQNVHGNMVTANELYQKANLAAGQSSRVGTIRRLNGLGK